MRVFDVVIGQVPATAAAFAVGRTAGGFWSREHGERLASSLCALIVVAYASLGRAADHGMGAFLVYLALDTGIRSAALPRDIALHHGAAAALTVSGLLLLHFTTGYLHATVERIVLLLLNMELTTPVLHAGWAWKRAGYDVAAALTLAILIIMWIPARLIAPWQCLLLMRGMGIAMRGVLMAPFAVVWTTTAGLLLLQVRWFVKLVGLALGRSW
jgi:hypothetical protein